MGVRWMQQRVGLQRGQSTLRHLPPRGARSHRPRAHRTLRRACVEQCGMRQPVRRDRSTQLRQRPRHLRPHQQTLREEWETSGAADRHRHLGSWRDKGGAPTVSTVRPTVVDDRQSLSLQRQHHREARRQGHGEHRHPLWHLRPLMATHPARRRPALSPQRTAAVHQRHLRV